MMTLSMLVVVAAALALSFSKRRRLKIAMIAIAAVYALMLTSGIIPRMLVQGLQAGAAKPASLEGRVALVLLGGGTVRLPDGAGVVPSPLTYSRLYEGVRLYDRCRHQEAQCTLFLTGGDPREAGASEAEVYRAGLRELGVRSEDIVVEKESENTWQNARNTARLLRGAGFDRVVLITSGLHMRRALIYFAHFGIEAEPAPSDYLDARLSPLPEGYNLAIADLAAHEYIGMLRYRLYNALGWNG